MNTTQTLKSPIGENNQNDTFITTTYTTPRSPLEDDAQQWTTPVEIAKLNGTYSQGTFKNENCNQTNGSKTEDNVFEAKTQIERANNELNGNHSVNLIDLNETKDRIIAGSTYNEENRNYESKIIEYDLFNFADNNEKPLNIRKSPFSLHLSPEDNRGQFLINQNEELLKKQISQLEMENKNLKDSLATIESDKTKYEEDVSIKFKEYEVLVTLATERYKKSRTAAIEMGNSYETLNQAYNNLFQQFEKAKATITAFEKNEQTYKNYVYQLQDNISQWKDKYEMLKQHSVKKFNEGNEEYIKVKTELQMQTQKSHAIIKRLEIKTASLEAALEQQNAQYQRLATLYDEYVGKI